MQLQCNCTALSQPLRMANIQCALAEVHTAIAISLSCPFKCLLLVCLFIHFFLKMIFNYWKLPMRLALLQLHSLLKCSQSLNLNEEDTTQIVQCSYLIRIQCNMCRFTLPRTIWSEKVLFDFCWIGKKYTKFDRKKRLLIYWCEKTLAKCQKPICKTKVMYSLRHFSILSVANVANGRMVGGLSSKQ